MPIDCKVTLILFAPEPMYGIVHIRIALAQGPMLNFDSDCAGANVRHCTYQNRSRAGTQCLTLILIAPEPMYGVVHIRIAPAQGSNARLFSVYHGHFFVANHTTRRNADWLQSNFDSGCAGANEIQITGKKRYIEEAKKRLRALENIALRRRRHLGMSLLHYPDKTVRFNASFVPLTKHDYFKNVVRRKKAFILGAASKMETSTQSSASNFQSSASLRQSSVSNFQSSASLRQSSTSSLQSSAFRHLLNRRPRIEAGIRLTDEEKLARKQDKKQQLAKMRKMRALGITNDGNGAVFGSSRRLPDDNTFDDQDHS
ncbi:10983_t:CDS:2 [Paraglomus occultum]|uniref:10983_t:CDS:1 n=1 Tax=Paraglomus occultum TaxID=144539 RepID=A0A9N9GVW9_9GLOM|nr:10983_t:CDS:2 [Paraglomus occultum]